LLVELLETRHVRDAFKAMPVKTDRNDAGHRAVDAAGMVSAHPGRMHSGCNDWSLNRAEAGLFRMTEATDQSEKAKVEGKAERGSWKLSGGALALALLTAILTGAVSYAYGVANDIRKTKLDFVNAQVEKLYGPLYGASQASEAVWNSFTRYHWRYPGETRDDGGAFFSDANPPTVAQVRRWRHWIRTVFQPLNVKMEEALFSNSHLLIGHTVPSVFRALIAHTEAYKAVIATWTDDDFRECQMIISLPSDGPICPALTALRNTAGIPFPRAVVQCIAADYAKLKQRQQELQSGLFAAFFSRSEMQAPVCD
jgi:hypothetical protein